MRIPNLWLFTFALAALAAVGRALYRFAFDPSRVGVGMTTSRAGLIFGRCDATTVAELRGRLVEVNGKTNKILAKAKDAKRDLTEAEIAEIDTLTAQFDAIAVDIKRHEKIEEQERHLNALQPSAARDERGRLQPTPGLDTRSNLPAGHGGFRHIGEFAQCLLDTGGRDPRFAILRQQNAAPTAFAGEGDPTSGGAVLPPDFRQQVYDNMMGYKDLLGACDQLSTTSNEIEFPTDTQQPWNPGGIQAKWLAENGTIAQYQPKIGFERLRLHDVGAILPVSNRMLRDSNYITGFLTKKGGEALGWAITQALISGNGLAKPQGIHKSGCIVVTGGVGGDVGDGTRETANSITFKDVAAMKIRMSDKMFQRAYWVMNGDHEFALMTMKFPGTTNMAWPVYLPPGGISATPFATLMGRPIIKHEAAPAVGAQGSLTLWDPSQYMLLKHAGSDVQTDISIHMFFENNATAIRLVVYIGGQCWWGAPMVRNVSALTYSPVVCLAAN